MAAQFILFILDLMRMLEEVGGEAVTNYLRRTTGLDAALAELRAIAEGCLPGPQSDDPDSDSLSDEYDDASENWILYYPPPVPRANPASKPAGADAPARTRARGPCNVEKAEIRHMPFHVLFVTISKQIVRSAKQIIGFPNSLPSRKAARQGPV